VTADRWRCIKCGTEAGGSRLSATIFDKYRSGRCRVCKVDRLHEAVAEPAVLRAEGEAAVLAAVENGVDAAWRIEATTRIEELIAGGARFTADDVTARVGLPTHRNAVGALLSAFARKGRIRTVAFGRGERSSQHSRTVRIWQGGAR
jgi:hypothetical protein